MTRRFNGEQGSSRVDVIAQAHEAFRDRRWQAAYDSFRAGASLRAEDYDALAESAHWLGRADDVIDAYEAAYRLYRDEGEPRRAAFSAFMLAIYLRLRGEGAQAEGWQARARRLLADVAEGPEHGYPLYLEIARLLSTDPAAATASARMMQDLGRRFEDDTLVALGVFFEGRALVKQARVTEGLALLDEAMVAAVSDRLKPMWTGAIYCGLLDACHELADHRRAREWTEATRRWVEPLPLASLYPGICRVHWASVLLTRGAWDEAEAEARDACRDLEGIDVFAVADAHYQIGEICRLRGDASGAEEAYGQAHALGRDPQPGLALLRLAQGRTDAARAAIRAALAGFTGSRLEAAPLLEADVQIALAVGDTDQAATSTAELAETAAAFSSEGIRAVAHRCQGALDLANGQAVSALGSLRLALAYWQELDAPYEIATTRLLLAEAYDALEHRDGAEQERETARACFERIGAAADLVGSGGPAPVVAGLSPRELEVLRLVATGLTNREIAAQLYVSEKTVARHVSNIFQKLEVSSRSAATAFAYAHDLMSAALD